MSPVPPRCTLTDIVFTSSIIFMFISIEFYIKTMCLINIVKKKINSFRKARETTIFKQLYHERHILRFKFHILHSFFTTTSKILPRLIDASLRSAAILIGHSCLAYTK